MVTKMIEQEIEELIEKGKDVGIDIYYPRELLINSILNKTKEDIMIANKRKNKIRRFIDNITNNDKKKLREKYMELKQYGYNTTLLIEEAKKIGVNLYDIKQKIINLIETHLNTKHENLIFEGKEFPCTIDRPHAPHDIRCTLTSWGYSSCDFCLGREGIIEFNGKKKLLRIYFEKTTPYIKYHEAYKVDYYFEDITSYNP